MPNLFNKDFFLNAGLMLKRNLFVPTRAVTGFAGVEEVVDGLNVDAVLIDIDQTVVPYGLDDVSEEVLSTLIRLQEKYKCGFLSNYPKTTRAKARVDAIARATGIPEIETASRKPAPRAFFDALQQLDSEAARTVMIGDRMLTDIVGANNAGMKTIYVEPIDKRTDPFFQVGLPRALERVYCRLAGPPRQR